MTYTSTTTPPPRRTGKMRRSAHESPYQQRTTERENPAQQLIKQAVDFLLHSLRQARAKP